MVAARLAPAWARLHAGMPADRRARLDGCERLWEHVVKPSRPGAGLCSSRSPAERHAGRPTHVALHPPAGPAQAGRRLRWAGRLAFAAATKAPARAFTRSRRRRWASHTPDERTPTEALEFARG
jgi:hypothetical protein